VRAENLDPPPVFHLFFTRWIPLGTARRSRIKKILITGRLKPDLLEAEQAFGGAGTNRHQPKSGHMPPPILVNISFS